MRISTEAGPSMYVSPSSRPGSRGFLAPGDAGGLLHAWEVAGEVPKNNEEDRVEIEDALKAGVVKGKTGEDWIWEADFSGERSIEVEKGVMSRREVRLVYCVWEEIGNTVCVLRWKAGQSYKAGEVLECQSVSEEILPMHLNNSPSSGWVCSLTTDTWWLQPQPTSCSAKAAACGWAGCTCLMPTTINKTVNFHRLICDKCFKSSQPSMPWLNHLFGRKGCSWDVGHRTAGTQLHSIDLGRCICELYSQGRLFLQQSH